MQRPPWHNVVPGVASSITPSQSSSLPLQVSGTGMHAPELHTPFGVQT